MEFDQDQLVRVVSLYFFTYFTLQTVGFLGSLGFSVGGAVKGEKAENCKTLTVSTFILLAFYMLSMFSLASLVLFSTGEGGSKIITVTLSLAILVTIPATVGGQNIYASPILMYTIPAAIEAFTLYTTG